MEQVPENEVKTFKVFLHPDAQKDLGKIHNAIVDDILNTIRIRLSNGPQFAGVPLKGTRNLLYKLRVSKYRVVYSIMHRTLEVWVLAVEPRKDVYRSENLASLLRIGIALHQSR